MVGVPMNPLRVAFDVGPLVGPRTGVGQAVAGIRASLSDVEHVEVFEYITSFRSTPPEGAHRLPIPAAAAHRLWAVSDRSTALCFIDVPIPIR